MPSDSVKKGLPHRRENHLAQAVLDLAEIRHEIVGALLAARQQDGIDREDHHEREQTGSAIFVMRSTPACTPR